MTTTASRFLVIGGGPQADISAGWTIRVLDYKDMTSLVAVIHEYSQFSFTQQLNDPGVQSSGSSAIWEPGHVFEIAAVASPGGARGLSGGQRGQSCL